MITLRQIFTYTRPTASIPPANRDITLMRMADVYHALHLWAVFLAPAQRFALPVLKASISVVFPNQLYYNTELQEL